MVKNELSSKVSSQNFDEIIYGKYSYKILPLPQAKFSKIFLDNNIELRDVSLNFSPLAAFTSHPAIKKISINEFRVISNAEANLSSVNMKLLELAKLKQHLKLDITNLKLYKNNFDIKNLYQELQLSAELNNHIVKGYGLFKKLNNAQNLEFNFKIDANNAENNLNYQLNNKLFKLDIVQSSTDLNSGQITGQIYNLEKFSKQHLAQRLFLANQIASPEKLKFTANFNYIDQNYSFNNIILDSPSLQAESIIKTEDDIKTLTINFKRLDLDNLFKKITHNKANNLLLDIKADNLKFIITGQNLKFMQQNYDEFRLTGENLDEIVSVDEAYAMFDKDNYLKFKGNIENNKYRSRFIGNTELVLLDARNFLENLQLNTNHDQAVPLALKADLTLSPREFNFYNLIASFADATITGSVNNKFIGKSNRFGGELYFDKLDLDKNNYPILNDKIAELLSLVKDSRKDDYLTKFKLLRGIDYNSYFVFKCNELTYNQQKYNNISGNLKLKPSELNIYDMHIDTDMEAVKFDVVMDISTKIKGLAPEFKFNIKSGIVELDNINLDKFAEIREQIVDNFNFEKINNEIDIKLEKLRLNNELLSDFKFNGNNKKFLLAEAKLDFAIYGGKYSSVNNFLISPFSFNSSYSYTNGQFSQLKELLNVNIPIENGVINISGTMSANGNDKTKLYDNFTAKKAIIITDAIINNFGADELVNKLANKQVDKDNIAEINKIMLTSSPLKYFSANLNYENNLADLTDIAIRTNYTASKLNGYAYINKDNYKFEGNLNFRTNNKYGSEIINLPFILSNTENSFETDGLNSYFNDQNYKK